MEAWQQPTFVISFFFTSTSCDSCRFQPNLFPLFTEKGALTHTFSLYTNAPFASQEPMGFLTSSFIFDNVSTTRFMSSQAGVTVLQCFLRHRKTDKHPKLSCLILQMSFPSCPGLLISSMNNNVHWGKLLHILAFIFLIYQTYLSFLNPAIFTF